ncbi:hypothetical protein JYK02_21525 [Corallococcus macrosporus]|uniref:Bacterial transcriptional activator domain-containing protein n=1 Tax=Corallococcus macrosporus TaxID=35 RepID=A0ABS3DFL8_9BACT|nr:hypothetical protein [Corallococcus macrosporus]MBN8230095.1 hypothetical protein [Corallococcus macrosporus]
MSERESMKLRELKETAHALYQRGKYAQCVETYAQLARRLPRDANVRIRLAEACRRAGQREQAIAAYREASQVLLSLGCESRARGALKAALELDPRDPALQLEVVRLGQGAVTPTELEDEQLYRFDRLPPPTPPPGRMRGVPPPPPPSFVLNAAQEPASAAGLPVAPSIAPLSAPGVRSPVPTRMQGTASGPGRDAVLPHPRPVALAGTPAKDTSTEAMSRSMAKAAVTPLPKVIVSMGAFADPPAASPVNAPPSIPPVTVDRPVPQRSLPSVPLALPALPRSPPNVPPTMIPERPTVKVIPLLNRAPGPQPVPSAPAPVPHAPAGHPHASALTAPPNAVLPYKPEMRRLAPNVVALRVSPQARWVIIRSESELEVSRSEELPVEPNAAH